MRRYIWSASRIKIFKILGKLGSSRLEKLLKKFEELFVHIF